MKTPHKEAHAYGAFRPKRFVTCDFVTASAYLLAQKDRNDVVYDLAQDAARDPAFPGSAGSDDLLKYLRMGGAPKVAVDALAEKLGRSGFAVLCVG